MKTGVSEVLVETIKELMEEPLLSDFYLGGGTNLAIKYNHRESIDIDLFSSGIVGLKKMNEILNLLKEKYAQANIEASLQNRDSENIAFIRSEMLYKGEDIKIEIIQNIKMLCTPEIRTDGIRLINDLDIGSLKLLAAADRGEQKDFYDLFLLADKYGLDKIYNILVERNKQYRPGIDDNLFNLPTFKPKENLKLDLSPLGNFNNATDKKCPGNRINFTDNSPINIPLPVLKNKWLTMVRQLADDQKLKFIETQKVKRRGKEKGLGF